MKRFTILVPLAVLCLVSIACDSSRDLNGMRDIRHEPEIVYFNSFESSQDVHGWTGIDEKMFLDDPAPNGGRKSLHIGGGCVHPTAEAVVGGEHAAGDYVISCWGRLDDVSQPGGVVLKAYLDGQPCGESTLTVRTGEWSYYASGEPLTCDEGVEFKIELGIGGIVAASMSLDCLKIERIDL
jgi:hypothetical protein